MDFRRSAALAVLVALAMGGCGGDDPGAEPKPSKSTGLRVERGASRSDLVIYVKPALDVPQRAGGLRQVVLECVDSDGDAVMAQNEAWPFAETDGGQLAPHAHMTLDPLGISAVERCLLRGTEPLLQGPVR